MRIRVIKVRLGLVNPYPNPNPTTRAEAPLQHGATEAVRPEGVKELHGLG